VWLVLAKFYVNLARIVITLVIIYVWTHVKVDNLGMTSLKIASLVQGSVRLVKGLQVLAYLVTSLIFWTS